MAPRYIVDPLLPGRLRQLRERAELSYRQLSRLTNYAHAYLWQVETGHRPATPELAAAVDTALDTGGELARMVRAHDSSSAFGQIRRRTVLAGLAISPAIAALADQGRDLMTVDGWREVAWEAGYTYSTVPRAELVPGLASDLAALLQRIQATTGGRRVQLCEPASRLAALTAMACDDLGRSADSCSAWRLARTLADNAEATDTQAWVRGQEAMLGLYAGRPLSVVLALADRGLALAGTAPSSGQVILLAARAQALALMGRADEAGEALRPLRAIFQVADTMTKLSKSIYGMPHHRVLHAEMFVRTVHGPAAAAADTYGEAIAATPPESVISRCQIDLHRATRLVLDGQVLDGVDHAVEALDQLPGPRRGRLVLTIADAVRRAVPAKLVNHPRVIAYDHRLVAAWHG